MAARHRHPPTVRPRPVCISAVATGVAGTSSRTGQRRPRTPASTTSTAAAAGSSRARRHRDAIPPAAPCAAGAGATTVPPARRCGRAPVGEPRRQGGLEWQQDLVGRASPAAARQAPHRSGGPAPRHLAGEQPERCRGPAQHLFARGRASARSSWHSVLQPVRSRAAGRTLVFTVPCGIPVSSLTSRVLRPCRVTAASASRWPAGSSRIRRRRAASSPAHDLVDVGGSRRPRPALGRRQRPAAPAPHAVQRCCG